MARYFADLYPTSRNTVVELDAKLAEYVRAWFDIPKAPRVKIYAWARRGRHLHVCPGFPRRADS